MVAQLELSLTPSEVIPANGQQPNETGDTSRSEVPSFLRANPTRFIARPFLSFKSRKNALVYSLSRIFVNVDHAVPLATKKARPFRVELSFVRSNTRVAISYSRGRMAPVKPL